MSVSILANRALELYGSRQQWKSCVDCTIPLTIHIGSGAGDDLSPGYVSDPGTRLLKS